MNNLWVSVADREYYSDYITTDVVCREKHIELFRLFPGEENWIISASGCVPIRFCINSSSFRKELMTIIKSLDKEYNLQKFKKLSKGHYELNIQINEHNILNQFMERGCSIL